MEDIHNTFTRFKEEFPEVFTRHEALGKEIHDESLCAIGYSIGVINGG